MSYARITNINLSLYRNICRHSELVTYLEFKLGAAKVSPLLLPEVVGFDDEGNVDARWERLLKDLQ